LWRWGAVGQ